MTVIRFKTFVEGWKNGLTTFITERDGNNFPFSEGEIICLPLEISILNSSTPPWLLDLRPYSKGADFEGEMFRVKVTKLNDAQTGSLCFLASETRNFLLAHMTIDDSPTLSFKNGDVIMVPLRVTEIVEEKIPYDFFDEIVYESHWNAWLIPEGTTTDDIILCEVQSVEAGS